MQTQTVSVEDLERQLMMLMPYGSTGILEKKILLYSLGVTVALKLSQGLCEEVNREWSGLWRALWDQMEDLECSHL